jgi:hypothetical protein
MDNSRKRKQQKTKKMSKQPQKKDLLTGSERRGSSSLSSDKPKSPVHKNGPSGRLER